MEPCPGESVLPEGALGPRSLATMGGLPESTTSWDPLSTEQAGAVQDHRIHLLEIVFYQESECQLCISQVDKLLVT